jgi:hypothetical protein
MKTLRPRAWLVGFVAVAILSFPRVGYACNPDQECRACLVRAPFTGHCIQMGNDPACEARKKVCQHCRDIKAVATGASIACITCVMVSGPAVPACVAICGGAAQAQTVASAGGC